MKTKLIRITEEHYEELKHLGKVTESFDQVVGKLLIDRNGGGQNHNDLQDTTQNTLRRSRNNRRSTALNQEDQSHVENQ